MMKADDVARRIQVAIAQLATVLAKLPEVDLSDVDSAQGISISLNTHDDADRVVIFDDARVIFAPGEKPNHDLDRMSLSGRPPGLATRTCPTCRGKGKV
jgi:hypothetical protein